MATWTPKPPDSTEFFPLDTARQLAQGDIIQSCACEISVIKGADPDAAAMLIDSVEINGSIVSQKVQGGVTGCRYRLTFTAQTLYGETLKLGGDFYVGTTEPGARDLTTLQAVKDWLAVKKPDDDALLQRLITAESQTIEQALQRPILPETRTDIIESYGSATIMPPITPIQSVEKAAIGGVNIPITHDALTIRRLDGFPWTNDRCIEVTYTAGFDEVPFDLEQVCIELVALRYRERERIGHQSKSIAGETVSFITRAMPHSLEARLAPYKKVAPV